MSKKSNDQGHIIEALKEKRFSYVWEKVKFIGIEDVLNPNERYLIFSRVVKQFDPNINNNFIGFYKKYLKYLQFNRNEDYVFSSTRSVVGKIRAERISPGTYKTKLVRNLMKWRVTKNGSNL